MSTAALPKGKTDRSAAAIKAWDKRGRKKFADALARYRQRGTTGAGSRIPRRDPADKIRRERTTPTPPPPLHVRVMRDADGDGITDAARVGVPADQVPPPPKIPRLPNLTKTERAAESAFADAFEKDPDGIARAYMDTVRKSADSNKFEVDAAKNMFEPWAGKGRTPEERAQIRSTMNTPLHQTANAIAKRAFLMHLDSLSAEDKAKGMLVTVGGCGCHAPGTQIMLADGATRSVEDVRIGDRLMGPDSKPRSVLRTIHGSGPMYRVVPTKGEPFVVNDEHVLSLQTYRARGSLKRSRLVTVQLSVKDVLARGASFRRLSMLHRTGVDFEPAPVSLDPYFLGLWLGDGTGINTTITTADPEVAAYVGALAETIPDVELRVREKKDNKAKAYQIVAARAGRLAGGDYAHNRVSPKRKSEGGNDQNGSRLKHIPSLYLRNSREVRLELLAGLLDSDGHLSNGGFDLITRWPKLAAGVVTLARSLGLACYASPARKGSQTGYVGDYVRLSISGDTHLIPTRIPRKRAARRQVKSVLRTGFKLRPLGEGSYYGFTLEGDGLYLLRDFTVTRNSGKGFALKTLAKSGMADFDAKKYGAVWDSAGDQNATENPWLLAEAKKRGIPVTYAYVSADPKLSWADQGDKKTGRAARGVVARAKSPDDGRMVDANVFADSYIIGARNHSIFAKKHAKDAKFIYVSNGDKIEKLDSVPDADIKRSRSGLRRFAVRTIARLGRKIPARVRRGALTGQRIWKPRKLKK